MGQYHKVVNLTKKEYISPDGLGIGVKALEQLRSEVSTQEALFLLLMCSNGRGGGDVHAHDPYGLIGRWTGDRIAVVGDYAADDDIEGVSAGSIYGKCQSYDPSALEQLAAAGGSSLPRPGNGDYLDLSPYLRPLMEQVFGLKYSSERVGDFTFYMREFDDD